jgi:hypothetical protein
MCCSASNWLHDFYCCFCCWFILLCLGLFLFSYINWGLLCALRYDQFCQRFHELLRRMYIVQQLDEIFCRHQLGPFDLWSDLVLGFFLLVFCLDDLSIGDRGLLSTPTTTVLEFIYIFMSFEVCLMKLGAYRFIIVICFWCIYLFISMECPSLSSLINVSLKSILSEISIATPACFGGHWLIKSSSSLPPSASAYFCCWDGSPVGSRLLDLPFWFSLPVGVFWWGN